MTTADLFRAEGCTCDQALKIRALLEARPEPLCAVHETDAIAARDAATARAKADYDTAVIRDAIRAASPPAPDPPPFLTLNDTAGIKQVLADALRAAVTEADPTTPLDAAEPQETS